MRSQPIAPSPQRATRSCLRTAPPPDPGDRRPGLGRAGTSPLGAWRLSSRRADPARFPFGGSGAAGLSQQPAPAAHRACGAEHEGLGSPRILPQAPPYPIGVAGMSVEGSAAKRERSSAWGAHRSARACHGFDGSVFVVREAHRASAAALSREAPCLVRGRARPASAGAKPAPGAAGGECADGCCSAPGVSTRADLGGHGFGISQHLDGAGRLVGFLPAGRRRGPSPPSPAS